MSIGRIFVVVCINTRFSFYLEAKPTQGRPASYLTRLGNEEGGLEEFTLTHSLRGEGRGFEAIARGAFR